MFSTADLEQARTIRIGQALGPSLEEVSSLIEKKALDKNFGLLAFLADQRGRLARKAAELQKLVLFPDAVLPWEDIIEGLENAPGAFIGLLAGRNFGKAIVRIAELPANAGSASPARPGAG